MASSSVPEALDQRGRGRVDDGEVAVVVSARSRVSTRVRVRRPACPRREQPSGCPPGMQAASTSPATSALRRVALPADVVTVLADQHVVAPDLEVPGRAPGPASREVGQRQQRRLRGVERAHRDDPPAQVGDRLRRHRPAQDQHQRASGRSRCRAWRPRAPPSPRAAASRRGSDPGQRGVPGDVHLPGQERLDQPLVVGVQHVVEAQAALARTRPVKPSQIVTTLGS